MDRALSLLRRGRGAAWLLGGRVSFVAGSFAFNALAARLLSTEDMGVLVYIQGLAVVLGMLACVQAGQAAAQELAFARSTSPDQVPAVLRSALMIGCGGGLLLGVISGLGFLFLSPEAGRSKAALVALSLAISVFCFAIRGVAARCFVSLGSFKRAAVLDGTLGTLIGTLGLSIAAASFSEVHFGHLLAILNLSFAIEAAISLVGLAKAAELASGAAARPYIPRLLKAGASLAGSNLVTQASLQVPVWVLMARGEPGDAGTLGLTARVAGLVGIVILVMNQSHTPEIGRMIAIGDGTGLARTLKRRSLVTFALATILCLPFGLAPGAILSSAFGSAYSAGSVALLILMMGQLFEAAAGPSQLILVLSKRERLVFSIVSASCLFSPLISLTLLQYGKLPIGAASLSVPMMIRGICFGLLARRAIKHRINAHAV